MREMELFQAKLPEETATRMTSIVQIARRKVKDKISSLDKALINEVEMRSEKC
jgi:hypothetical protein